MANGDDRRARKDRYEEPVRISMLEDDMNRVEAKQNEIHLGIQRTNKYIITVLVTLLIVGAAFVADLLVSILQGIGAS